MRGSIPKCLMAKSPSPAKGMLEGPTQTVSFSYWSLSRGVRLIRRKVDGSNRNSSSIPLVPPFVPLFKR